MKYEKYESLCYNLYTIKTDKFKTCHMEIVFKGECSKENITSSALLFDVLMDSCEEYPTHKMLTRKLEDLYNTSIYSVNSRVGGILLSNIVVDFLDPKYMDTSSLEDIIKLTFSLIFKPNIYCDEFDSKVFEIVHKRLKDEIESVKEDTKSKSILSALKLVDKDGLRGENASGDTSVLDSITPKKLYTFYKNMLENYEVDIYIIGNLDMKLVNNLVKKYALFNSIKTDNIPLYLDEIKSRKVVTKKDTNNLSQTNLVLVYSLNNLDDYEVNYVMPLFNLLWGSGSLESKLYKKVRGENGLCYNISSYYQKYDRVLIVHTGIDKENYNKTLKLIKQCENEMRKGDFKETDLDQAKNMMASSLSLIYDSESKLVDNYLFSNIAALPSIDKRIDEFMNVSKKDLVNLAKKIKLVANYRIGD